MDAVSGNHLCVTLMMIAKMDRMKLVVVCYFNGQMIFGSFEKHCSLKLLKVCLKVLKQLLSLKC